MIRKINGKKYLMRDQRSIAEIRAMYTEYVAKFGSKLTFEQWLAERGKIYTRIREISK